MYRLNLSRSNDITYLQTWNCINGSIQERLESCVHWQKLCVCKTPIPFLNPGFSAAILVQITDKNHCRDHVKELNNQRPKQPFFFLKPPSSILPPGAGPVIRPKGVELHYEVELALIMGKQVKDMEPSEEIRALESIESTFPYSCLRATIGERANDVFKVML